MAGTLLLQNVDNMTSGTTTVNLYGGTVKWAMNGWQTRSESRKGRIWETMNVVSTSSAANIRTEMENIDALFETAQKYMDNPVRSDPVWLYWQSDGESTKRALITDGESEILTDQRVSPLLDVSGMKGRLAMERMPWWESDTAVSGTIAAISADGAKIAFGTDTGSLPQRISRISVYSSTAAYDRMWLGIRPNYWGTADLETLWNCSLGFAGTDTTNTADANAYGGSAHYVTFATDATLALRTQLTLETHVTGDTDDFVGRYLVLARMQPTSGTAQFGVQLRYGYNTAGTAGQTHIAGYTYVDSLVTTNYDLYELGEVQIPPTPDRDGVVSQDVGFDDFKLQLYAERISAAGTLHIDCIFLMPTDHLLYGDKLALKIGAGTAYFYTAPNDEQWGLTHGITGLLNIEHNFHNWHYPVGGGVLVVLGSRDGLHLFGGSVQIEHDMYPRWRTFRG